MTTIKDALAVAAREIGSSVKEQAQNIRQQIKNDREVLIEVEKYVQSIIDIDGKHEDKFELGQQSVATQVAQIIGYQPKFPGDNK